MQRKIFINFVVVLLVGVIICGLLSVEIIEKNYNANIEQRLEANASLLRELIGDRLLTDDSENLDKHLASIKNIVKERVTIVAADGRVLGDTDMAPAKMGNHADRPEIKEAFRGHLGKSKRYSDTLKVDFLYVAVPIYRNGSIAEVLRLSTPLYEIRELTARLYMNAFISIITGLIIASLLGYRLSIKTTKPIREMTAIASQISHGQFEKRIELENGDEIGELADSINHMASTLNDTINNIKDKNIKMEAILSSVVNGIIAIDSTERILFINPVAVSMLAIEEKNIVGKHFLQVVRNNQLDNFLKDIIREENFTDMEITLSYPEEKTLRFYTNPIRQMDREDIVIGIIITIQDITELRKLEKMRTEFVANVSHELKTPLTSIKGFAETLKSGAIEEPEDSIRFLNIIEDEADRLNRLIADILSLSELENKKMKAVNEKIDIGATIDAVTSMLASQASKKNIQINAEIDSGLRSLMGDPDKIKQMFINLIDNAIKYTPENGKVRVEAYNQEDNIVINIIDNGIGIPKDHIPRLFERFYRVDKARSRRVGGTGLGLAIVKHIVKLFDGEIEVESKVGEGTKFKITIPAKA